jgi:hypothetical protein
MTTTIAYRRAEERLTEPVDGAPLDLAPVVGTWLNADKGASGSILRMHLAQRGQELAIRVFGATGGEPYDWGEVIAGAYANSVTGNEAWAFIARYDFGFMETSLFAYTKTGILVQTTYSVFRDGSGRANYWTREFFHREEA